MPIESRLVELGIGEGPSAAPSGSVVLSSAGRYGDSLICRLPRDAAGRAGALSAGQIIEVSAEERVVVLENGVPQGALGPGRYALESRPEVGSLDLVWVNGKPHPMSWTVIGATDCRGSRVSSHGVIQVRVQAATTFCSEIVDGPDSISADDLSSVMQPRIGGALRAQFGRVRVPMRPPDRHKLELELGVALLEPFGTVGLEVVRVEVAEVRSWTGRSADASPMWPQACLSVSAPSWTDDLHRKFLDASQELAEKSAKKEADACASAERAEVPEATGQQGKGPSAE